MPSLPVLKTESQREQTQLSRPSEMGGLSDTNGVVTPNLKARMNETTTLTLEVPSEIPHYEDNDDAVRVVS
jgi:hypothetical protein